MGQFWLLLVFFITLLILYVFNTILFENIIFPYMETKNGKEGFEDITDVPGLVEESGGIMRWMSHEELYDPFYAQIYDQLTQGSVRNQAEIGLILHEWTKQGDKLENFEVLDGGCGTGIACAALAKMGVKTVVGLDNSKAMLKQCEVTLQQSTLTDEQKQHIVWKQGDLMDPGACTGGQVSHAILLYFTIYYFPDKETVFRNLFYWIRPGGRLVVHVVNKHKFDPMLESSAPWLGFSLQKYSDTRIKKSEVVFNKFKYTGEFDLQDPIAEFREVFHFKNGKVRRQKHIFRMEDMNDIVELAKTAGWTYIGYTDLTPISFEYAYHLHFRHS
jgi:SAM-dependent methyltransferase